MSPTSDNLFLLFFFIITRTPPCPLSTAKYKADLSVVDTQLFTSTNTFLMVFVFLFENKETLEVVVACFIKVLTFSAGVL